MKTMTLNQMEMVEGGRDGLACAESIVGSAIGLIGLGILIASTGPAAPMTASLFFGAFGGGIGTGLSIAGLHNCMR
jgi:hypothetical protein